MAVILLLALSLRVGWVLTRAADEGSLAQLPDQLEYLQAGRNLLHGDGLWFTDARFGQDLYASRTVGYPLLVAACGGKVRLIQFAQCLIDTSTVLAVWLIARRLLTARRSLIAAGIVAVNPLMVYFCGLVLSETLYVAAMAWSVFLVTAMGTAGLGILLAALSVHVRPAAALMPMVLGAWSGWVYCLRRRIIATVAGCLLGGVALAVVLTPWAIRNHAKLGQWVWLTTNGGITLYDGVNPNATGASDQSFVGRMPELKSMGEVERDRYLRELGNQQITRRPGRFIQLAAIKIARTWSPVPLSEQFSSNRLYMAAGLLYSVPLFVLALWGLVRSSLAGRGRLLLVAPAVVLTIVHAATVGSMRYRVPAEPMLAVLAAGVCLRRQENRCPSPKA